MITKNKDKDVVIAQYILASCCYVAVIIGGCVLLSKAFGRGVELEIIPRAKADVTELKYVEDMKVIFGDEDNQYRGSLGGSVTQDSGSVDTVVEIVTTDSNVANVAVVESVSVSTKIEVVPVLEVPVSAPQRVVAVPETKPKPVTVTKKTNKPVVTDENGIEDAWEALKNKEYDKVLKICKGIPPGRETQYLRAKALFGQFKLGQADGRDVIEAFALVKSRNDLGSKWYNEADSILTLFKR